MTIDLLSGFKDSCGKVTLPDTSLFKQGIDRWNLSLRASHIEMMTLGRLKVFRHSMLASAQKRKTGVGIPSLIPSSPFIGNSWSSESFFPGCSSQLDDPDIS